MRYPRDCVGELLELIAREDPDDPPGSRFKEINDKSKARFRPLPEKGVMEDLLDTAWSASQQPEEGRPTTFALAFLPPGTQGTALETTPFSKSVPLSPRSVVKLASATDPAITSLGVWSEGGVNGPLAIWGLVSSENRPLAASPHGAHPTFLMNTSFLFVRIRAPGVIYVYYNQLLRLLYARGEAYFQLEPGRLHSILCRHAHLNPTTAHAISQIATRIALLDKGGSLLVTDPNLPVQPGSLDVSRSFEPAYRLLADAAKDDHDRGGNVQAEHTLTKALDFVSRLSQVDGAVHLTSDLVVKGFGAKITGEPPLFSLLEEQGGPGQYRVVHLGELSGTRHRSAALFCAQQPRQALAVVISQDGDVTLFGRQKDGSVLRMGPFALGAALAVGA